MEGIRKAEQAAYWKKSAAPAPERVGDASPAGRPNPAETAPRREQLYALWPGVTVTVQSFQNDAELREWAAASGGGVHLTIDAAYLERMLKSPEEYQKGKEQISRALDRLSGAAAQGLSCGVVIDAEGKAALWQAPPAGMGGTGAGQKPETAASLAAEKTKEKENPYNIKRKVNVSSMRELSRLARTATTRDVRSMISKLYANAYMLKSAGSTYEKADVKRGVTELEGVIRRAKQKLRNLEEESLAEKQQKKAEQRREAERALRLKIMLNRRKTARRSREYAQVYERFVPYELRRKREDWEEDRQQEIAADIAADAAAAIQAVPAAAVPSPVAPEAIVISRPVDLMA